MTWEVGSWIFDDPATPSGHNASFVAIDVGAISPREHFDARLRKLIDEIHATPTADGIDQLLLPGEHEWKQLWQAEKQGIALPIDVLEKLREAASLTSTNADWLDNTISGS